MEKRLTRTEMLFSLGFIFMLVVAVAAFLYGMKVGAEETEAKYVPSKKLNAEVADKDTAYQQQDLVSYYHTVFLPYREFLNEWVAETDRMKSGLTEEPADKLKELAALADKQYKEAAKASLPAVSPLLVDAHTSTLKSLKLFKQAAEAQTAAAKSKTPADTAALLFKDAYYKQAAEYALQSQQEYYSAMLKWGSTVNKKVPGNYEAPSLLDLATWKAQPILVKNKLIADQLEARKLLTGYHPQDMTARIDAFIASGQASKMKIKTVSAIVDLLLGTEAVRGGDFMSSKSRFYSKELLPQLPFFIS
ncbi:hypothetical protein DNH61_23015 [Paenibacillus sambharensis]|uniref:Uncharacterized protein n=1 Tax=Paenibacillus sambharensis TaxID=1803190 RepID=A0A2W1LGB1_9BACL|nr:hypothetical protein [Paenibacillus sambharensis]PZD93494.1 hypothetical protein DNH61_23015 [Paenibacillus sambharensis]